MAPPQRDVAEDGTIQAKTARSGEKVSAFPGRVCQIGREACTFGKFLPIKAWQGKCNMRILRLRDRMNGYMPGRIFFTPDQR
jgi:hypothetical protein